VTAPLKNVARLELAQAARLLLVDTPEALRDLCARERADPKVTRETTGAAIRSVKESFDAVLVWREDRAGSRSVFDNAVKRLEPGGALWAVTALKKVRGPTTPAVHRLELSDLVQAFSKEGLEQDREVRVSPWHVAYRFVRGGQVSTCHFVAKWQDRSG